MIVRLIIKGKSYNFQASQLVAMTDDGQPIAIAYQNGKSVIQSDAVDSDFGQMLAELRIGVSAPIVDAIPLKR